MVLCCELPTHRPCLSQACLYTALNHARVLHVLEYRSFEWPCSSMPCLYMCAAEMMILLLSSPMLHWRRSERPCFSMPFAYTCALLNFHLVPSVCAKCSVRLARLPRDRCCSAAGRMVLGISVSLTPTPSVTACVVSRIQCTDEPYCFDLLCAEANSCRCTLMVAAWFERQIFRRWRTVHDG